MCAPSACVGAVGSGARSEQPRASVLPATVFEPGYWECDVDGSWMPYGWPCSSVLEQAYCQGWGTVEFRLRRIKYNFRFSYGPSFELGRPCAAQVNTETGKERDVRRWASKQQQRQFIEQQVREVIVAWQAWLTADWAWLLLDQKIGTTGGVCDAPHAATPPRDPYSLGLFCSFNEPWWPDLMRRWPTQGLSRAAHPEQRRCGFASWRMTCLGTEIEWAGLQTMWERSGISNAKLVGAYRIQNRGQLHGFAATRQAMLARLGGEDSIDGKARTDILHTRLLWHGTKSCESLLAICNDGFDRAHAATCAFGKGCYFATGAHYADRYACAVHLPTPGSDTSLRAMLIAAVLVGECCKGSPNMYPPPVKPHSLSAERFENACDNVSAPSIYVTFKDFQAVPVYVAIYTAPAV